MIDEAVVSQNIIYADFKLSQKVHEVVSWQEHHMLEKLPFIHRFSQHSMVHKDT